MMKTIKDEFTGVPSCISQQEPFESIEVSYANEDSKIRVVRETYLISEIDGYLLRHIVYDENDSVIECVNTQISVNEAEMITRIHEQYHNIFRYIKHDEEALQQIAEEIGKVGDKDANENT